MIPSATETLQPYVEMILDCLHREYPNKISHVLRSDRDVASPRQLTPMFFGCFDWHSAVHGHWSLVRALSCEPELAGRERVCQALSTSLTEERARGELAYLQAPDRAGFEMPYGISWLAMLVADLRTLVESEPGAPDSAEVASSSFASEGALAPVAASWLAAVEPLADHARARTLSWLQRLPFPIRTGEHTQTAFGLGLLIDAARTAGDHELDSAIVQRASDFYGGDRAAPLDYEPSGYDFLSPCLAEADLMRRVLDAGSFSAWLTEFLPHLGEADRLVPVSSVDPSDGKLSHLDGLNLSRSWMLDGISEALAPSDPRRPALQRARDEHRRAGLDGVSGRYYAGSHWLGTFAIYLVTRRGLARA